MEVREPVTLYPTEPIEPVQAEGGPLHLPAIDERIGDAEEEEPEPWWQSSIKLSEASPEQLAEVWSGKLEPRQLWWCVGCCKVFPASEIRVYDDAPHGEIFTFCPYCPSTRFYWWYGWPSNVLERWTARPEPGGFYPMPQDWLEEETEEPGIIKPR